MQFPNSSASPSNPVVPISSTSPATKVANKGNYVMSGFRDAELQKRLEEAGWKLQDRIAKTTTILLIPDDAKETTKVKAAKEAGIRIILRSAVNSLF